MSIHENCLTPAESRSHAGGGGHVGEVARVVAIQLEHRSRTRRETEQQVGVAVGVVVGPGGGARRARVSHARRRPTFVNVPRGCCGTIGWRCR